MKNYFFQNQITQMDYVPQGYHTSDNIEDRMTSFIQLTAEQETYYAEHPTANMMQVYYCGNIPQPEPILPTLEERKKELREKFAIKQMQIKQALITAEETVGSDNATLQYLKTQLLNERVRIITIIDNFTTIDEAIAFDIRDEDAKPFMDELYNLINSI